MTETSRDEAARTASRPPADSGAPGARRADDVRLLLLERAGCHLCAAARTVLETVSRRTGEPWASVEVDSSPALLEAYGELIPLALVDGRECGYWRLDAAAIEAALHSRRAGG